jgi:diaminopropionate ammonia-lyase
MRPGAHAFMTLPDTAAVHAMRALAAGIGGDRPVVGGEAGVGGLAGLLASCADPMLREALGLRADSRILIFGSEGDTDPALYEKLVGRSGAAVRADGGASHDRTATDDLGALLDDDGDDGGGNEALDNR